MAILQPSIYGYWYLSNSNRTVENGFLEMMKNKKAVARMARWPHSIYRQKEADFSIIPAVPPPYENNKKNKQVEGRWHSACYVMELVAGHALAGLGPCPGRRCVSIIFHLDVSFKRFNVSSPLTHNVNRFIHFYLI